ncbi:MAG: glycosyltransferase family 2 protein, partial [Bacteroidia bacterium]
WLLTVLWRMVLDGVSAMKFLFEGKSSLFVTVIKAHFAYCGSLGKTFAKRRELKKLGDVKVDLYANSVVWQYFVKGKKKFTDL